MSERHADGPMTGRGGRLRSFFRGFTLIELLIVVTLIGVLGLMGAINILRSRMTGNETVTLANMRQLAVALRAYHTVNNTHPDPLGLLSDAAPPYLAPSITGGSGANGSDSLVGYAYEYAPDGAFDYTLIARPTTQGVTGVRRFFIDETGVLRYTTDGTDPGPDSPLVQ